MDKVLLSVDIEATGESPTTSSCVMIGCVVFREMDVMPETPIENWLIEKKAWCIKEVENRPASQRCISEFWVKHPELMAHIKNNAIHPTDAMLDFANWFKNLSAKYKVTIVARPASYDWQWINCLYHEFGPKDKPRLPFSIVCLSTIYRTIEMLVPNVTTQLWSSYLYHPTIKMTHFADDDAACQAYMYLRTIYWLKKNITVKPITN